MTRSIVSVLAFAGVLGTSALSLAAEPSSAPCTQCAAPFNDPAAGPFARRDYITRVEPYKVTESDGKHSRTQLEGAIVELQPAPGITRELLQRLVENHVTYLTSTGAASSSSPLAVVGSTAAVSSTGDGFAITIRSKDSDAAKEILRRAEALRVQ
jgi:hypothetical protein